MRREKNYLIQCYRGLICFLVVQNHMWPLENWFYHLVWGIAGASMGLFLLISGYFMYTEVEEKQLPRLKKKIWGTFVLTVQVLLFYYIVKLIPMAATGELSDYASKYLAPGELFKLIFPNSTAICGPMWYMVSLLYSTILLYGLVKYGLEKKAGILVPFLLLICLCLSGEFHGLFSGLAPEYARFFLIHGFPFVLSGYLFHKYQTTVLQRIQSYVKLPLLVLLYVVASLWSTVVGCNVISLASILLSFALLVFAILHPKIGQGSFLERVGTNNSVHIYLMHWCFTSVAVRLLNHFPSMHWTVPYIVAVLIWLLCIGLSQMYLSIKHLYALSLENKAHIFRKE